MARKLAFLYGAVCYIIFFVTFLYAIGFIGDLIVPKTIDNGPTAATFTRALIANVILMSIFAVQHSVMARPAFKKWWTRWIPKAIERSTYVLLASLALDLLFWQWRSMPDTIWNVSNEIGRYLLIVVFFLGWGIVLFGTFLINHFDLFGLRQVYLYQRGEEVGQIEFRTPALYRMIRHPIMIGFIIAFWATPTMSVGHLLFALVTTIYILVAIQLEERDLIGVYGETYEAYRRRVSMLLPIPKRDAGSTSDAALPTRD